jgi:hypothetical protein
MGAQLKKKKKKKKKQMGGQDFDWLSMIELTNS